MNSSSSSTLPRVVLPSSMRSIPNLETPSRWSVTRSLAKLYVRIFSERPPVPWVRVGLGLGLGQGQGQGEGEGEG